MNPEVRIGIVSWNTAPLLDLCLSAIPAALGSVSAEVVVVDNASGDDSVEVARRHKATVIRNTANVGYAKAMNQALATDDADILVALNPDTVPAPGSLACLVDTIVSGSPDVALVVPRLLNGDRTLQHSVYRFPSPAVYAAAYFIPERLQRGMLARRFWFENRAPHDRAEDIDWAIGAVHVIRRSALEGRPPYDERWFMYVEDLELCWWLRQHGWRIRLEPGAEVVHIGNAAGVQAWGHLRTRRHVAMSLDWYVRDKGQGAARLWAFVNLIGILWWSAVRVLAAVGTRRTERLAAARDMAGLIPLHLEVVLHGRGTADLRCEPHGPD
jgi:GT2 family glycosyltransferase